VNVFSLNYFPSIQYRYRVRDYGTNLIIIGNHIRHIQREVLYKLLGYLQLVLDGCYNSELQDYILNGIEVHWRFLACLIALSLAGWEKLLVHEDAVQSIAPGLYLDLLEAECRDKVGEESEFRQTRLLLR